ncbi:hypothetical protein ABZY81_39295 [Streptomyces sp. NPDC006514]|uniref:hypothetical protein n=1 Tax=Streptomyces sp. NPDC006514 TaxID=3154308 RepID=UPI0033AACF08
MRAVRITSSVTTTGAFASPPPTPPAAPALAAAGLAFFVIALTLHTRWPCTPGAALLASVLVGRRPRRRP